VTVCVKNVLGSRDNCQIRHNYQNLPGNVQRSKLNTFYAALEPKVNFPVLYWLFWQLSRDTLVDSVLYCLMTTVKYVKIVRKCFSRLM